MTPFAKQLRLIRKTRSLKQRELAVLLGFHESYISILETQNRGVTEDLINKVISKLDLTVREADALALAAAQSKQEFKIPQNSAPQIYEICAQLEKQLPKITERQVELIKLALKYPN